MDFVVLSSSRGTTFQAVLEAIAGGSLTARCLGLVTDREDRGCVEKAKAAGIPVKVIEKKESESREDYDRRLHDMITSLIPSPPTPLPSRRERGALIAALGWMFIFSPWFIAHWKDRIINVHPALLPKFGGAGMYGDKVHEAVLASGDTESGITIHLMDDGVDTGRILLQKTCPVLRPEDTVASLKARVQGLEREWYPKVLQMIERGEMKLP